MNLAELIAAVEDVIQDTEYTETVITSLINEAVLKIATGDIIAGKYQLSPPLPELYKSDDVLTVLSTGYLSLPADYNRNVFMVVDSDNEPVFIEESFKKFMIAAAGEYEGGVVKCAINGSKLYYMDTPAAAATLTLHYYTAPDTLTAAGDIPSSIPIVLHRKLIVGYVCREIFNKIEDGIEGKKVNTVYYANEYAGGLLDLDTAVGLDGADGSADYIDNQTDYI